MLHYIKFIFALLFTYFLLLFAEVRIDSISTDGSSSCVCIDMFTRWRHSECVWKSRVIVFKIGVAILDLAKAKILPQPYDEKDFSKDENLATSVGYTNTFVNTHNFICVVVVVVVVSLLNL